MRRREHHEKALCTLFGSCYESCTLPAGCGQDNTTGETTDTGDTAETSDLVYAVSKQPSARRWPPEKGWEFYSVTAQADALMEVDAGTSDDAPTRSLS